MTQQPEQDDKKKILQNMQEDILEILKDTHHIIRSENSLENELQEEIAKQITLLQKFQEYIVKIKKKSYKIENIEYLRTRINCFRIALDGLLKPPTEKKFARILRYESEYFLNRKSHFGFIKTLFQRATRGFSTPTQVLFGLAMAIPIYAIAIPVSLTTSIVLTLMPDIVQIPTYLIIDALKNSKDIPKLQVDPKVKALQRISYNLTLLLENSSLVIMVAFAGAFGSIVSIFIRLDQYKSTDYKGSSTPILVGFAKPLIGTAFAILVCSMLNSGIITSPLLNSNRNSNSNDNSNSNRNSNPNSNSEKQYFLYFTIAFLIGFSERLATDIVKRAEDAISPQEKTGSSTNIRQTEKKFTEKNLMMSGQNLSMGQVSEEELQHSSKEAVQGVLKILDFIYQLLVDSQQKDSKKDSTAQPNSASSIGLIKNETTEETKTTDIKIEQ